MNKVVHRVDFEIDDQADVWLPSDANIIHVAASRTQPDERIDMWYETVRTGFHVGQWVTFHIEGTGHPIARDSTYVGTVICPNDLVWHVYRGGVS